MPFQFHRCEDSALGELIKYGILRTKSIQSLGPKGKVVDGFLSSARDCSKATPGQQEALPLALESSGLSTDSPM